MKKLVYQAKEIVTKQTELNASVMANYITKLTDVEISSDELMEIWDSHSPETKFRGTKFDFSIEHPFKCIMQNFVDVVLDLIYHQILIFDYDENIVDQETNISQYSITTVDVNDHIRVMIPDTTIITEGIVKEIDDGMLYGTWGDFGVNSYSDFIQLVED